PWASTPSRPVFSWSAAGEAKRSSSPPPRSSRRSQAKDESIQLGEHQLPKAASYNGLSVASDRTRLHELSTENSSSQHRTFAPKRSPLWIELIVVAWLCWIYDLVSNLAPVREHLALAHAASIWRLETTLHLDPEASLDHWLASHHSLAAIVSNYYDNAHFV